METLDDYLYSDNKSNLRSPARTIRCSGKFIRNQNIAGMNVELSKNAMVIRLTRGWLYRVWRRFHWQVKKGVGLNKSILTMAKWWKKLIVIMDLKKHEVYVGDPFCIMTLCNCWVTKVTKSGIPIYACPISLFYRYKNEALWEVRKKLGRVEKQYKRQLVVETK